MKVTLIPNLVGALGTDVKFLERKKRNRKSEEGLKTFIQLRLVRILIRFLET